MKLYKAAHTVYKTQYHIVWITRYRRKIFLVTGIKSYLKKIKLQEIRKYYPVKYALSKIEDFKGKRISPWLS